MKRLSLILMLVVLTGIASACGDEAQDKETGPKEEITEETASNVFENGKSEKNQKESKEESENFVELTDEEIIDHADRITEGATEIVRKNRDQLFEFILEHEEEIDIDSRLTEKSVLQSKVHELFKPELKEFVAPNGMEHMISSMYLLAGNPRNPSTYPYFSTDEPLNVIEQTKDSILISNDSTDAEDEEAVHTRITEFVQEDGLWKIGRVRDDVKTSEIKRHFK